MRRPAAALLALLLAGAGLLTPLAAAAAEAERATIVHVLQRLTYGPRPGDVERVEAMGLEAWLEGQLDPARLDDAATERALAALPTLTMSIADLHAQYPRPGDQNFAAGEGASKRPIRIAGELQAENPAFRRRARKGGRLRRPIAIR